MYGKMYQSAKKEEPSLSEADFLKRVRESWEEAKQDVCNFVAFD